MKVVSDTSPISYLVSLDLIQLIPRHLGSCIIPSAVARELRHPGAPTEVRRWIAKPPVWLSVQSVLAPPEALSDDLGRLQPGEREAILLARHWDRIFS